MLDELHACLDDLGRTVAAVPWYDKHVYGAFLAQTYYYVRHSTRLLALAASRFRTTHEQVHRRFIRHATEEMSHETLALHDLKHLGLSIDRYREFPSTRAFYQTQYYLIEHVSPWSFWGYILMLEGLALTRGSWLLGEIEHHHGKGAGSFVRVHAAEDVGHMAEARKVLRSLPGEERPGVIEQIEDSSFHYRAMLEQCTLCAAERAPARSRNHDTTSKDNHSHRFSGTAPSA